MEGKQQVMLVVTMKVCFYNLLITTLYLKITFLYKLLHFITSIGVSRPLSPSPDPGEESIPLSPSGESIGFILSQ